MICGLLFFAASVNYMDRQVIGLLKPTLQAQFGWTEIGYSNIVLAFTFAYGASLLVVGKLIDRIGTRKGFSFAVLFWSISAMAHAAAGSVFQFAVARLSLGIGESGSFPASIKAVAEWFPKKERALATGIFNSGTNVGRNRDPFDRPLDHLSFRMARSIHGHRRIGTALDRRFSSLVPQAGGEPARFAGGIGLHSKRSRGNCATVPWRALLRFRQTWAVGLGKFFTDPIWSVYLFWMPDFLSRNLKLDLKGMALPLFVIYSGASVGSVGGGWLSSRLIKEGWTVNASRKTAMLICALQSPPSFSRVTPRIPGLRSSWWHWRRARIKAGRRTSILSTSDMFPRSAVASVVGFGTLLGTVSGMLLSKIVGYILQSTGPTCPSLWSRVRRIWWL